MRLLLQFDQRRCGGCRDDVRPARQAQGSSHQLSAAADEIAALGAAARGRAVTTGPYQICTRCIMDTSDPGYRVRRQRAVAITARGWFKRAAIYALPPQERARRLEMLVEEMKRRGRGKDYDCIIGVSGGVDSSFVAIKVKELGLRPLAIHVDNGWNSGQGRRQHQANSGSPAHRPFTVVLNWKEFRDAATGLPAGVHP